MPDATETLVKTSKAFLRKFVPDSVLHHRDVFLRLGPQAGRAYVSLCLLDAAGIRKPNRRLAPADARSFLFVCHGNIMRSAMSEFFMREALQEAGLGAQIQVMSAGLHAITGKAAHTWAQQSTAELGVSLAAHRAKPLSREMAEQTDCIFAMDFENKAELLTLYPEFQTKIYMLSAYAQGAWQYRAIPDPNFGNLEITQFCARQLQTCIRNLVSTLRVPPSP
jgi:protein arginine phosphatase